MSVMVGADAAGVSGGAMWWGEGGVVGLRCPVWWGSALNMHNLVVAGHHVTL